MSRSTVVFGTAALVVMLSSSRAPQRVVEGSVMAFTPAGALSVANEQTDPTGVRFVLVRETRQDGAIRPGARVRVWYWIVGDARWVADRVLVMD